MKLSEINTSTSWHQVQRKRVTRCLDKIDQWPHPLKGLVGAKLINLTNAIDSLNGKPRNNSNHDVVSRALAELEEAVDRVVIKESANA